MRYFAYGSNLFLPQLRCRCPSARFECRATLAGRKLAFTRTSQNRNCGVADIVKAPGEVVWGAVLHIEDADMARLDVAEGVALGSYARRHCQVLRDNDADIVLDVESYFAAAVEGRHVPSAEYLALLIAGATEWGFPGEYIAMLRAMPIQCDGRDRSCQ